MTIRIAVVGVGKIARDQHLPVIVASPDFALAALVSRHDPGLDAPWYPTLDALLASETPVDAIALCTPTAVRYDLAALAMQRGVHCLLEKPPAATLSEFDAMRAVAEECGTTLFASWHSRFAACVGQAQEWLAGRHIKSVAITWREDVRHWHPGQDWIWEPEGFGVFDPGSNALSIATKILPRPFFLTAGTLGIPANRAAPIAADLIFSDGHGAAISMDLDWRQTGPQSWNIVVETDAGTMKLTNGGANLTLPGDPRVHGEGQYGGLRAEYAGMYAHFAALVAAGQSDADIAPLRHVADAFLRGRRVSVEPFDEQGDSDGF